MSFQAAGEDGSFIRMVVLERPAGVIPNTAHHQLSGFPSPSLAMSGPFYGCCSGLIEGQHTPQVLRVLEESKAPEVLGGAQDASQPQEVLLHPSMSHIWKAPETG